MFHLYGFFIGLAIVTGYSIAEKIEPRVKDGAGYIIFAGILGARLYHVLDFFITYFILKLYHHLCSLANTSFSNNFL